MTTPTVDTCPCGRPLPTYRQGSAHSQPRFCVLDLFAGSGSAGIAAKRTGRKALLYEVRESQCEAAARRLAQDVLPMEAS